MNSAEVLIKFKGDTSDVDKTTKNLTNSFGKLTSSIALGNLASKGITKAFEIMNTSMDGAIRRVDTMNNFPNVMSNLGISAEDSAEVIDDLSKKLQGLPTTLDTAAASVQRFTSKNGDVKESEKIFLALNNAILAGGAPAEQQASAMEQLSQAYAKGKPDMMEWRSMMSVMPAQLKQVATAMGYVDADALGEDLRNGNLSMDEFINTMIKMNTEGVNGFKSFEEQARNSTGGIDTAITNMKTAFVRGVGNIITKVSEALEPFGGLSGVITKVGQFGEQAFKKVGEVLAVVIPKVIQFAQWIKKNEAWIKPLVVGIATFVATFKTIKTVVTVINAVKIAFAGLNAIMMANPIGIIIAAVAALVAVFIYLWNHCEGFRNFWIGLWQGLVNIVKTGWNWIKGVFDTVVNFIKNNWQGLLLMLVNPFLGGFKLLYDNCEPFRIFINNFVNGIKTFFNNLKTGIGNAVNSIVTFIKSIPEKIKSIPDKIFSFFKSLPSKMLNIGLDIVKGIGKGITSGVTWLKNQIKAFVGNVTNFIKKIFKIGSPSKLMASEVGQWLPKGIAVGIDANTDSVTNAMKDLQQNVLTDYGLSPEVTNSSALNYSPNVVVNVQNNMDVDPLGQVVNKIKTFSGGAKNDYNWGAGI